jgi:hypothetical protein
VHFHSLVRLALPTRLLERLSNNQLLLWLYYGKLISSLTNLRWLLILLLEDSLRELVHQCRSSCDGVCHLIQRRFGDLLLSLQWLREGATLAAPLLLIDVNNALELYH